MKLNKSARARSKMMTASEKASIRKSARVLFDYQLMSSKRFEMIARNYV
jgi:hypothetical protein